MNSTSICGNSCEACTRTKRDQLRGKPAKDIATWLWTMFAIQIFSLFSSLCSGATSFADSIDSVRLGVSAASPSAVSTILFILSLVTAVVRLVAQWQLGKYQPRFRKAFLWELITYATLIVILILVAFVMAFAQLSDALAALCLLLLLGLLIVEIVAAILALRHFYHALSSLLDGIDGKLSADFLSLWKWYIGVLIGILPAAIVISLCLIISQWLGIALLASALVFALVLNVRFIIATFRSAETFGMLSKAEALEEEM